MCLCSLLNLSADLGPHHFAVLTSPCLYRETAVIVREHLVLLVGKGSNGNCLVFFLPPISRAKVCEEKLRYAAYNCVAIDTDMSPWEE